MTRREMSTKEPICDFCSARDAPWVYEAESYISFVSKALVGESVGAWAACESCKRLIDANDRKGLAKRAAESFRYEYPEMLLEDKFAQTEIDLHFQQIMDDFFTHRREPPLIN